MLDDLKAGTLWQDDELDAIVSDYFSMLEAELAGRPYVKAHHSAALMRQIGRTHGSVEFKHQNISAVLDELGLPWIPGYKPKRNYQEAIFDAIDRYLSAHQLILNATVPNNVPDLGDEGVFVEAPPLAIKQERPRRLEQLVKKFDPVERDHRNRTLGMAGESFVLELERQKLTSLERPDLAHKVRWVAAEDGDGAGYDILSFSPSGRTLLIEVKTTNGGPTTPFFISRNECHTADTYPDCWRLYRVHLFAQTPRIFTIAPPLSNTVQLQPESLASFVCLSNNPVRELRRRLGVSRCPGACRGSTFRCPRRRKKRIWRKGLPRRRF